MVPTSDTNLRFKRSRHWVVPVISLELWDWSNKHRANSGLDEILVGQHDTFFRQWAMDAARYRERVILRFGFEMNGDWFSWGGQPKLFRQAWLRARKIFAEEGAGNVEWMFAPNVLYASKKHLE